MLYESTRGQAEKVGAAEAIKQGLAPDGGLFVPEKRVTLSPEDLKAMMAMTYQEKAVFILKPFLSDFTEEEIVACVNAAYSRQKFDSEEVAPLVHLKDQLYLVELWHGPTAAFKDMALQILPHLLTLSVRKTGCNDEMVILVATSGDTGKAALEGFRDVPGTRIIVFYPDEGVSEVQKRQMITQEGSNVGVVAVVGNFDDTQSGVKAIFSNRDFSAQLAKRHFQLSSANSINWGRLVPQIVYYIAAYVKLQEQGAISPGEKINIVVPTGNFGNILAAFYARQMGLPVKRLICAANANHVLTDFMRTGIYDRRRPFFKTISPSMDILISSNLERLLYDLTDRNADRVRGWMEQLSREGWYAVDAETLSRLQEVFWSDFASDEETLAAIAANYRETGYVLDTHTAVAKWVYDRYLESTGDTAVTVIASTASPFKFSASVVKALLGEERVNGQDEFELLHLLADAFQLPIPAGLKGLEQKPILHTYRTEPSGMEDMVGRMLGVS